MGEIRLLGCSLNIVGDMARKLLVALRPCSYFRPAYYKEGKMVVLEKGI